MIPYGMLYAAGVGLPIFLAALVTSAFLRRHGRAERGVWVAALLLALTLPVVALTRPASPAPAAPVPVAETSLIGLPAVVAVPDVRVVAVPSGGAPIGLDEILVGLWLLASLALTVRWAVAAVRLARATRRKPFATVDGVRVLLTRDLGPAVAGWIRPRILVPSWLMSLPREQRSLVLLHEQEHVRAGDPLLVAGSRIFRTLAPWNPFVWLISSRLLRAVELDCDRRVLRRRPDVRAYGTTLLTVSARHPGALVGAAAFAEAEAPLRRRILAMTTPPGTVSVLSLFTALVLGILLILGALQVPVPAVSRIAGEASSSEPNASVGEVEAMRLELEAALAARAQAVAEREMMTEEISTLKAELALLEERVRAPSDRSGDGVVPTSPTLSGTITGTVTNVVTNRAIENVQVFLRGIGIGGLTDEEGRFELLGVPAGEQEVVAQRIGFGEVALRADVVGGGVVELDIGLQETAVELDRLLVTGGVAPTAGSASEAAPPLIYVDGVRVESRPSRIEGLVRPEEIDRIEVIKGAAAVTLYGAEARGGVVQIFTKQGQDRSAPPTRPNPSGGPTFTPFTVAPTVLNGSEVRQAMREAYPPELRSAGVGGTVEVWFFITEEGTVQDYRISEGSGQDALDDAALAVAGTFRFSPALNRDERVPVWVSFPITFVPAG